MNEHVVKLLRRVEEALASKSLDEKARVILWADVRTELTIHDRAEAEAQPARTLRSA